MSYREEFSGGSFRDAEVRIAESGGMTDDTGIQRGY